MIDLNPSFLEFEQPAAELAAQLVRLRTCELSADAAQQAVDLEHQIQELLTSLHAGLTPWQVVQLARHPARPYTLDYAQAMLTDFSELHGDRMYADDPAIVGGVARLDSRPVMVIGTQKGRDLKDRTFRNYGMPRPEGYRKALRLMKLAEKFHMPVLTFIDTPGAYPGIDAEERGQAEAIGRNLFEMANLQVPVIATVTGEGGSGGALALGVGDAVLMLSNSTYSVISPEGCASILWKSASHAAAAAQALALTAPRLKELGLVDSVIQEPVGGAHRAPWAVVQAVKEEVLAQLAVLDTLDETSLLQRRHARLAAYGRFTN